MSSTTARHLLVRRRNHSPWRDRFATVADRLVAEYGVPTLGNFRDPVKEIFYILLSARTTDAQYRRTHRNLLRAYPTLADLAKARVAGVRKCIASGGLDSVRARHCILLARELLAKCGPNPARYIRSLDPAAAYAFLAALPGVGPKSALCVAMYSLGADVFPVDANVQRIAERMGAIRPRLEHRVAQRRLAAVTPDGRSRELHIAMVVHGRKVCRPANPKCGECCLADLCKRGRKVERMNRLIVPS